MDSKPLTKHEIKLEKKRLREEMVEREKRQAKMRGLVTKLALAVLIAGAGWWIYKAANTKPPGEAVADLGREHVPEGTAVEYNSNPPTSGPHFAQWEKPGYYDRVLADGRLIHSLEHGYIVISYNCDKISNLKSQNSRPRLDSVEDGSKPQLKTQNFRVAAVYAHETEEPHEEPEASGSAGSETDVSGWKEDSDCQNLISELKSVMEKSGAKRLILVPRPSLEIKIALTAWGKIDKMDEIDQDKILRFIRSYHNKGPERTME